MFSISLQINSDCVLQYYFQTVIEMTRKKTNFKASITYKELTEILSWKPICENEHGLCLGLLLLTIDDKYHLYTLRQRFCVFLLHGCIFHIAYTIINSDLKN